MATVQDVTDRLRAALTGQAPLDRSVKLDLKGEGTILLRGGTVSNADEPADCTVTVSLADLVALAKGRLDPAMAMMRGRIKVQGDMSLVMTLQPLLARVRD